MFAFVSSNLVIHTFAHCVRIEKKKCFFFLLSIFFFFFLHNFLFGFLLMRFFRCCDSKRASGLCFIVFPLVFLPCFDAIDAKLLNELVFGVVKRALFINFH